MRCKLILLFIILNSTLFAQQKSNWGFESRIKSGFLIGHRVVMGHLPVDHTYAVELAYVFRPNGEKSWHKHYKYPDLSINLYYGSVGNTQILGNYVGTYASISFPFIRKKKFRLSGKIGSGLGYTPKVYDPVLNKKNVAISTHINAMINLGIDTKTYFGKNWISAGIDLTHFSNGSTIVPNLGLNIPQIYLGYGRFISSNSERVEKPKESVVPQRKLLFGATAIASAKQIFPSGGKTYPVFGLNLNARMFMKPRVAWEVSFDIMSKQSLVAYRSEVQKTQWKMMQMGIFAAYLLPLNNLHFVFGMGVYVKNYYNPNGPLYHRVGMRYYFKNGINLNLVLKAHWGKADYIEWGIGYSLFNHKKHRK